MNGPIYTPSGAAKEYGDYALNIYTGCPHRCWYCFAPGVLHRDKEEFHGHVEPRKNIIGKVKLQLEREDFSGKTVHLCFTCDPYPTGYDSTATREAIKLLKAAGAHVQILTKGDGSRDLDLLDAGDWYGITLDGGGIWSGPGAKWPSERMKAAKAAHEAGIKTWVSFEPVTDAESVLTLIETVSWWADKVKIGKLNYHPSDIDWADFGERAEELCQDLGVDYYIKESLRREMGG